TSMPRYFLIWRFTFRKGCTAVICKSARPPHNRPMTRPSSSQTIDPLSPLSANGRTEARFLPSKSSMKDTTSKSSLYPPSQHVVLLVALSKPSVHPVLAPFFITVRDFFSRKTGSSSSFKVICLHSGPCILQRVLLSNPFSTVTR